MPHLNSQREPQRNGAHGNGRAKAPEQHGGLEASWSADALRQEMERLAAANEQLLAGAGLATEAAEEGDALEVQRLRVENAELRRRLDEVETAFLERADAGDDWAERQKEYEALLEEKSEVIRELHQRLQEAREAAPEPRAAAAESHRPMDPALHEDLLLLKQQLEEERAQLEQDEEALMQQLRQMEMAMSRERAEMARQRAELQRLHNDLRHEMELASRDSGLRDRLAPLQRRQQDVAGQKSGTTPAPGATPPTVQPSSAKKNSSGLFRRLFGAKDE